MFAKILVYMFVFLLLTACAAPAVSPAPTTIPTHGGQELTLTPTETLTPTPEVTPTPEPTSTSTPLPEGPWMEEITFNLTNGGTLSMPGFFTDKQEGADEIENYAKDKELLEKVLEYIVEDGVAWGDIYARRTDDGRPSTFNPKYKDIKYVPGWLGGINGTVAIIFPGATQSDQFQLSTSSAEYNGNNGVIVGYIDDNNGIEQSMFIGIDGETFLTIINDPLLLIPQRPQ